MEKPLIFATGDFFGLFKLVLSEAGICLLLYHARLVFFEESRILLFSITDTKFSDVSVNFESIMSSDPFKPIDLIRSIDLTSLEYLGTKLD